MARGGSGEKLIGGLLSLAWSLVTLTFGAAKKSAMKSAAANEKAAKTLADVQSLGRRKVIIPVVGESHKNADGMSRQQILKSVEAGDPAWFVREKDNPASSLAIAVHTHSGQVGYVGSDVAAVLARMIDQGDDIGATISLVAGDQSAKGIRGVWLKIWRNERREPQARKKSPRANVDHSGGPV
jgi:hypothetical protein